MIPSRRLILLALGAALLAGCSGRGDVAFEPPVLSLSSFGLLPSEGKAPRIAIGLRVVNPNGTPLRMRGLSYTVALEGHRMVTGVTSRLAEVPPYAETEVELNSPIDLISSIRLFNELINTPGRQTLKYSLNARIDVDGMLAPLRLIEDGELVFTQFDSAP
ncbi:MAG: LEA type 2 family protein [Zoogloeaceae bacterium]|nr:LEA type 2 family protein [Zoogloeaceae bacterium]